MNLVQKPSIKHFCVFTGIDASLTFVDDLFGSKAILFLNCKEDFQVHYTKIENLYTNGTLPFGSFPCDDLKLVASQNSAIAELEDTMIVVDEITKEMLVFNQTTTTFKSTHTIIRDFNNIQAYFKTSTRWLATNCKAKTSKFFSQFGSCLTALKYGLMLPNQGEEMTIRLSDGNIATCSAEDPYSVGSKCPSGWFGRKTSEKCLKISFDAQDNENAARY